MLSFSRNLSDADIMSAIRAGGKQRRLHENKFYEKYQYFIKDAMFKHKIAEDDAASAYSDTIFSAIDSIVSNKFEGRSELKTYLFQIFSNKCVDIIRKNATNKASVHAGVSFDDLNVPIPDETKTIVQRIMVENDVLKLHQRLASIGDKCKRIVLAWGEGYSDEEISADEGYKTAQVAKTTRLRCLEKLKELYHQ